MLVFCVTRRKMRTGARTITTIHTLTKLHTRKININLNTHTKKTTRMREQNTASVSFPTENGFPEFPTQLNQRARTTLGEQS